MAKEDQPDQPRQSVTLAELTPDMVTGPTTPTVLVSSEELTKLTKLAIGPRFEDPAADLLPPVPE